MPIPRMSSSLQQKRQGPLEFSGAGIKAAVTGAIGDNAGFYYVSVNGLTVKASAVIDAPIRVGDVVWVRNTSQGWIIDGVGA